MSMRLSPLPSLTPEYLSVSDSPPGGKAEGGVCLSWNNTITQVQQGENFKIWEKRQIFYNKLPGYCKTNVMFKKNTPETLVFMGCNRLSCPRCRSKIKKKLLDRIYDTCIKYNLLRQLVLTCPGRAWRDKTNVDASFNFITKKFTEFKILYTRETGKKLNYVKLSRSQSDGFCHLHILLDRYIKVGVIKDILKRVGLGSSFHIKYMDLHRLRDYLRNDFFKDHEWYIPYGMRHISSSMLISEGGTRFSIFIMWIKSHAGYVAVIFGKYIPPQKKYDFVADIMLQHCDRPPPFWFFLYCYRSMHDIQVSGGYIADYKKSTLPCNHIGIMPGFDYQQDLSGRMRRITTVFEFPVFTSQKRFRVDPAFKRG